MRQDFLTARFTPAQGAAIKLVHFISTCLRKVRTYIIVIIIIYMSALALAQWHLGQRAVVLHVCLVKCKIGIRFVKRVVLKNSC